MASLAVFMQCKLSASHGSSVFFLICGYFKISTVPMGLLRFYSSSIFMWTINVTARGCWHGMKNCLDSAPIMECIMDLVCVNVNASSVG